MGTIARDLPESVCFIKTELELKTGLVFSAIAVAAADRKKAARNTANARKAYNTACVSCQRFSYHAGIIRYVGIPCD